MPTTNIICPESTIKLIATHFARQSRLMGDVTSTDTITSFDNWFKPEDFGIATLPATKESNHFYLTTESGVTAHVNMNPNADTETLDAVKKMIDLAYNMELKAIKEPFEAIEGNNVTENLSGVTNMIITSVEGKETGGDTLERLWNKLTVPFVKGEKSLQRCAFDVAEAYATQQAKRIAELEEWQDRALLAEAKLSEANKRIAELTDECKHQSLSILKYADRIAELEGVLMKAVDDYGKPGGPWNVPSEPGTWIDSARKALTPNRRVKN